MARKTSTRLITMGAAIALMVGVMAAPATAGMPGTSKLSVVHGVPGLDVDVCLDGNEVISDFNPGEIVGPIDVASGPHNVSIHGADAAACAGSPVLAANLDLVAGKAYSGVAHLNANGDPVLSAFVDNLRPTKKGEARLTVRHIAAAPATGVWANGAPLVTDFTNGESATLRVPKGIYAAWVSLDGDYDPVIGPSVLKLNKGTAYTVYAWGSASGGSLALAVQTVPVGTA